MHASRACRHGLMVFAAAALAAACGADSPTGPRPSGPPVLTSVRISVAANPLEVGQSTVATATALDQFGAPIVAGAATYSSTTPEVAGVSPATGEMLAIAPGTTIISATIDGRVARLTVAVMKAPILINEVRPDGTASGGWIELFNPTGLDVDVSEWTLTAGDVFQPITLPAGTTIKAGGYLAIDETTIPGGLRAEDAVHVFSRFGVQVAAFAWAEDPPTSYGRCPDGTGAFVITREHTKGSANACAGWH